MEVMGSKRWEADLGGLGSAQGCERGGRCDGSEMEKVMI